MKPYVALTFAVVCAACARNTTIGEKYIGAKYVNNPLGEGMAPDADPLIRFDAFDCTTFVETALADGDIDKLTKIRYKNGIVNFVNRNHFTETDWLQNNSNLVSDVTARYGKTAVRNVRIDRANWLKKNYGIADKTPIQTVSLRYIPYKQITNIGNTEPMVVLFVGNKYKNKSLIGTDLAIMHMGLLLPNGVLRHASSEFGRVMDVDFYEYIANRQKYATNLGVMLLEIKK